MTDNPAEFHVGDNCYDESDDDFSTMHLATTIDGRPVRMTIEFEEPQDILAVFFHLGKVDSLENLRDSLELTYREKEIHDALSEVDDGKIKLEDLLDGRGRRGEGLDT